MSAHMHAQPRRHTVRGGIFGFLFGLFLALDLFALGVVASDSVVLTILPIVGLVGGIVLGRTTPLRRRPPADALPVVVPADVVPAPEEGFAPAAATTAPVEPAPEPEPEPQAEPEPQTAAAPPGWYPVPGDTRLRWWDGTRWTEDYSQPSG